MPRLQFKRKAHWNPISLTEAWVHYLRIPILKSCSSIASLRYHRRMLPALPTYLVPVVHKSAAYDSVPTPTGTTVR